MSANQILEFRSAFLERFKKEPSIGQLIFVRRIGEQFKSFLIGSVFVGRRASEFNPLKSFFVREKHTIVERKLGVQFMSQCDMAEFVSQHHGERTFVWQYLNEASAQDDGMTYRKRLQRRSQQYARANSRLNVQVVRDY